MYIVFTICLMANLEECEERALHIYEPVSPVACLMGAQGELARWRETHPDWRIQRWRCQGEERQAKK